MKKSKKGYALPTAIVVTTVLLLIAAAFASVTYNNINVTSRDLSSRQAYINAKSALIYTTAYYKQNPTQIPAEGATNYIVMKADNGSTTQGATKIAVLSSDVTNAKCYVEVIHNGSGRLTLTANAKYNSALGGGDSVRKLTTELTIDIDNNTTSGSGYKVELPAPTYSYEDLEILFDIISEETTDCSIYVKRNENAKYLPYVYTWAYATTSHYDKEIDAIATGFYNSGATELNPSGVWRHGGDGTGVDASAVTELETNGRYKGYYGLNLLGGQMMVRYYGTNQAMLDWYRSKGDTHYASSYATSTERINKISAIITVEGADDSNNQSNEMFDIPTTRGPIFIDTLTAELNYYDRGTANTLTESSNDGKVDVYTQNTIVHVKLQGYNGTWDTVPSIYATRLNSAQPESVREQNSIMDSVDPLTSSYKAMVYEGNGWYKYSIPTSANFTANIKGSANGTSINLSDEYIKCTNGYDYYLLVKGSGSSAISSEQRPTSDNSVTVHVKVSDSIKGSNTVQIVTSTSTEDKVEIRYTDDDGTVIETETAYLNNRVNTNNGLSFSKAGFRINGWVLEGSSSAGTEFGLGVSIKIVDSYCQTDIDGTRYVTFKPVWTEESATLQIEFYDEGKKVNTMSNISYSAQVTFDLLTDTEAKYFKGWSTSEDGTTGTMYKTGIPYTITSSMKLYAQWENYLSVTFEANGGILDSSTSDFIGKLKTGDSFRTAKTPTREGYTFRYWSTSPSSTGTHYDANKDYPITATITLYAIWQSDTSTTVYFEAPASWTNNTIYVNTDKAGKIAMSAINGTNIYQAEVNGDTETLSFSSGTTVGSQSVGLYEGIVYRVKGYDDARNAILDTTKTYTGAYYVNGYVIYAQNNTENYLTETFNVYAWTSSDKTFGAKKEIVANKVEGTNISVAFVPNTYSTYNITLNNTNKIFAATPSGANEPYYLIKSSYDDWKVMSHMTMLNNRIYYSDADTAKKLSVKDTNNVDQRVESIDKGKFYSVWSDYEGAEPGYIYYYSDSNYQPKAYMWGSGKSFDWNSSPLMEDTGKKIGGKTVYRIKCSDDSGVMYENVIFYNKNNESQKTVDLPIVEGKITNNNIGLLSQTSTLFLLSTRNLSDAYDISTHKNQNYVCLSDDKVEVLASHSLYYTVSESIVAGNENIVMASASPAGTLAITTKPDKTLAGAGGTSTTYNMVAEDTRIYYKNKKTTGGYDTYGLPMDGDFGWRGRRRGDSREVADTWYVYNISSPELSNFKIKIGSFETEEITNIGSDLYIVIDGEALYVKASKTPYAYLWSDGAGENAAYPGVAMTKVAGETNVYKIASGGYNNVIFAYDYYDKRSGDESTAGHKGKIYDMDNRRWVDYAGASDKLSMTAYTSNPDNMLTKTTRVYYNSTSGTPTLKFKSALDNAYTEVTMNKVVDDTTHPNLYYYDVPNDKTTLLFNGSGIEQVLPTNGSGTLFSGTGWSTYTSPSDELNEAINAFIAAYRKFTIEEYNANASTSASDLKTKGKYTVQVETIDGETFAKLNRFNAFKDGSSIVSYAKSITSDYTKREVAEKLNDLTDAAKKLVEKVYTGRCYIPAYNMDAEVSATISDDEVIVNLNKAIIEAVSQYSSIGSSCTYDTIGDTISKLKELTDKIDSCLHSNVSDIDRNNMFGVAIPATLSDGTTISNVTINYTESGTTKNVVLTDRVTNEVGEMYYYYWLKTGCTNVYFKYKKGMTDTTGDKKSDFAATEQWIYDVENESWKVNTAIRTEKISAASLDGTTSIPYTYEFKEDEEIFYIEFEKDCQIKFKNPNTSAIQTETIYAGTYYMYVSEWKETDDSTKNIDVPSYDFYMTVRSQMYDTVTGTSVKMAETVGWLGTDGKVAIKTDSSDFSETKGKTINFFVPANTENLARLRSATAASSSPASGSYYEAHAINFKWYNSSTDESSSIMDMKFTSSNSLTLDATTVSIGTGANIIKDSSTAHFYVGTQSGTFVIKVLNDIKVTNESGSFTIEKGIYTITDTDRSNISSAISSSRFDILASKDAWSYLSENCKESTTFAIEGGL